MNKENPKEKNEKTLIAPSILSADFARLADEIQAVEAAGADIIHVDVMDGHFVPDITIGPLVVAALRKVTKLPLDVHLMVSEADKHIDAFARAGADWITIHVESGFHLHRSVNRIKEHGKRAGLVLNPATSLTSLDYLLGEVDLVMLMSVNPGYAGQSFIGATLRKIKALREMARAQNLKLDIEVDGGVAPETIGAIKAAGANIFVAGSAVFSRPDYSVAISRLREQAGREESGALA